MKNIYTQQEINIDENLTELNKKNKLPKGVYLAIKNKEYIDIWKDLNIEVVDNQTLNKNMKIIYKIC